MLTGQERYYVGAFAEDGTVLAVAGPFETPRDASAFTTEMFGGWEGRRKAYDEQRVGPLVCRDGREVRHVSLAEVPKTPKRLRR